MAKRSTSTRELIDTRKDKRYVKRTANEWSSTPPRRPAIDESVRGRLRDRADG